MEQQNLTMKRGDSFQFTTTVTLNGSALDISGYSVWVTAKRQKSDLDAAAIFQLTKAGGAITVGGAGNNVATTTIPPASTASLTADTVLYYDVQIESPGGKVDTVAEGVLTIGLDVTQTS